MEHDMEECKYRKIVCSDGHESSVFSEGERLPKYCPVCNQPYDRKYNPPIFCYQDGRVPSTEINDDRKKNNLED